MALRIGQQGAVSFPEVLSEEPEAEMPMMDEMPMEPEAMMPPMGNEGGRVSQESARYFGPEYRCGGCVHFMEGTVQHECEIVAGEIQPDGVCSLYTPDVDQLGEETDGLEDNVEDVL